MHRAGSQRLNPRRPMPSILSHLRHGLIPAAIGVLLFLGGIGLLFWNEGRAVQRARSLGEAVQAVRRLEGVDVAFEENNGKLVHLTGVLDIQDKLAEEEYGVAVPCVKLKRRVQMFQWVEEESLREYQSGDHPHTETSYSYYKDWKDKLVNSGSFSTSMGHENPREMPIKTKITINNRVKVGNFLLGKALKELFSNFVLFTSDERPENLNIKMHAGLYYHSHDVYNPEVGDIRIQFSYAGLAGDEVTVIAMQSGRELRPYQTSTGDEILLLREGKKTPEEVFSEEHAQNWFYLWVTRVAGWFAMFMGTHFLSNILNMLVSRFSMVRDLIALGVTSLNFTVSASTSLLVIASGWIWFRPLIGFTLLFFAATPFVYSSIKMYRQDNYENRFRRQL